MFASESRSSNERADVLYAVCAVCVWRVLSEESVCLESVCKARSRVHCSLLIHCSFPSAQCPSSKAFTVKTDVYTTLTIEGTAFHSSNASNWSSELVGVVQFSPLITLNWLVRSFAWLVGWLVGVGKSAAVSSW